MRTMPWGGGRKTEGASSGSCRNAAAKESDVAVVEAPVEVPVAWVPSFALGELGSGVDERNWERAADEMVDSRWYAQVGPRAERLVDRMRNVS